MSNDIRLVVFGAIVVFFGFIVVLACVDTSHPCNLRCLRVIAHLSVDPDWKVAAHARKKESGLCRMAELIDKERHRGH